METFLPDDKQFGAYGPKTILRLKIGRHLGILLYRHLCRTEIQKNVHSSSVMIFPNIFWV